MDPDHSDAPPPLTGGDKEGPAADEEQPGYWAEAALENPWRRGRRNIQNMTSRRHALRRNGLYREPVLRVSRSYDGPGFYRLVGWRNENVEALLAQATGAQVVPEKACDHCQRSQGLFASCVIIPGRLLDCANCHWAGQGHRCSFRVRAPTEYVPLKQSDVERRLQELRETREDLMAQLLRVDQEIAQPSFSGLHLLDFGQCEAVDLTQDCDVVYQEFKGAMVTGDNQFFIPYSLTSPVLFAAFKKGYVGAGSVILSAKQLSGKFSKEDFMQDYEEYAEDLVY
ncbi:hypothetical protein N7454_006172 [Penicillium verhagenii]|nr:hypothetical protein N7454_006172 [Penicillium verhagenii]